MTTKTLQMTISATGCAQNGMEQVNEVKKAIEALLEDGALQNHDLLSDFEDAQLGMAHIAISALHDGLMALVRGDVTIEAAKDFFFGGEIPDPSDYFNDIIKLNPKENPPA